MIRTSKKLLFLIIVSSLFFTACKKREEIFQTTVSLEPTVQFKNIPPRFKVRLAATINDTIAYNGKRGIYIITDNENQKEFIGISGIGISELNSHAEMSGKNITTRIDER